LCENAALPGREEYLDSEKYQWKERDWNAPGNIKPLITRLNRIRKENRALHFYDNLRFYPAENDAILFYGKATVARDNIILIAVNLDPAQLQSCFVHVPLEDFELREDEAYQMHDLLTDARYIWHGRRNYIELNPHLEQAAHVFRLRRAAGNGRFV
jgi:starch synthase (maltosyl-transferring)